MRLLMGLATTFAVASAYAQSRPDPVVGRIGPPRAAVCPNCGHLLRSPKDNRLTFKQIAEDLEAAAADGGPDGRVVGMLARAVRIMEADAATGDKLHELYDPAFRGYPGGRAPYGRVAEVLSSRRLTEGLSPEVADAYAKIGRVLLDDGVCVDLRLPSEAGEWSSCEQIIRTLNAITDKYARPRRMESEGQVDGRYSFRRRP